MKILEMLHVVVPTFNSVKVYVCIYIRVYIFIYLYLYMYLCNLDLCTFKSTARTSLYLYIYRSSDIFTRRESNTLGAVGMCSTYA